jgi:3-oxocholest-4-en-26-oyl-CoA dehydrogenase alpha subunit
MPTTSPGFSYTKIETMVNASTFTTYYDDVRVPDSAVVYGVNRGWDLIVNQLNYERVSLAPAGMFAKNHEDVLAWARTTTLPDGRRVIDQQWVQVNLARVHAQLEFLKLINWKVAAREGANPADASATKVFGTEFFVQGYKLLMEVLGTASALGARPGRSSPGG